MMLFRNALFLATKIPKNIEKLNFSIEFSWKLFQIFAKCPQPV